MVQRYGESTYEQGERGLEERREGEGQMSPYKSGEIQRERSKKPWLGPTTKYILVITVPSLPVPSLP
jgi:hypothetical protein